MIEKSIFKDGANKNLTHPKNQKGITLTALVITMGVMMALLGASVTAGIKTGIFKTAAGVAKNTQKEMDKEVEMSSGKVAAGDKEYDSLEDYFAGQTSLPEGLTEVDQNAETVKSWNFDAVRAVTDGTVNENNKQVVFPLPNGFSILEVEGKETKVDNGIVIKDNALGNEFVWVPVTITTNYRENYVSHSTLTTAANIKKYYGDDVFTKMGTDADRESVFTLNADKTNIENSVKKYGGFYVGRYETTYDSPDKNEVPQGIGVKPGKNVLNAKSIIKAGENPNDDYQPYYYRWWGLYKAQKDMYAGNSNVGSLMIADGQWDKIMTFTGHGNTKASVGGIKLSGLESSDEAKNIYDLAGNVSEMTLNRWSNRDNYNTFRGGAASKAAIEDDEIANQRSCTMTTQTSNIYGSRCTLYIK